MVKSIIHRLKNRFNISIAETDLNNRHEWAQVGFAVVGNDARMVNSKIDKVMNTADEMGLAMIADSDIEIIHL